MGTTPVRIPDPLYQEALLVQDDRDFATIGEALRQMSKEGGYEV